MQGSAGEPDDVTIEFDLSKHSVGGIFKMLAKMCHGPGLDIPNERLLMQNTTVVFTCGFGHLHKFVLEPMSGGGAAFRGKIIKLAKAQRAKAEKPLLYGPDGRAAN